MKPKSHHRGQSGTSRGFLASTIFLCVIGGAQIAGAQTWINTTTGTSNWSAAANWNTDPTAPVSANTTAIQFFPAPGTVIPAASAIVANQDIATPMILNTLTVNGTGPGTGTAPSLTISGGTIQFAGTSPALNVNAGYGTVGYTVNLNTNLDFSADSSINFSGGGAFINVGTAAAWSGAGKVTFTGGLTNRPLSLTAVGTFTGDVALSGSSTVLQLNKNHNILGPNSTAPNSQTVTVPSGSGVTLAYGNAAYIHPQNFVVSGDGNSGSGNAAIRAINIGFGNGTIGGLALAADSTIRTVPEVASEARGVTITRGIVGTGKLIKTGGGYLFPSASSPASVTWGGTLFSSYTGNVEIREGAIQTPAVSNALGTNTATTQRVTVSSGASMVLGAGNNAWTQPQNIILNGNGTGYVANNGGFAALDSFGAGFGNNTVRRIVVATDSNVAAKRDGGANGVGRGIETQQGLSGTGTLSVGAPYGNAISPLYLNQAASAFEEFPAFSGKVIINNGILSIGNTDALGASPAGQITLNSLGAVSSSLAGGLNQAFLARIENLATTGGAVCLGVASSNNLDFTTAPNLRLGAINNSTYSGTLTPAGGVYRLGGGGGTLTVSSQLTGTGNSVVISGSVVLSNASNDFDGGITIASNNTGTGQTASLGFTGGTGNLNGNAISFGGAGGTLAYTGGAAGSSDTVGVLSFSTGHSNVTSTKGAAGNTSLTFSAMTARSAGATGNFAISGGTNGTDNKITVTGLATGFVDKGVFFGDFNYAYNDAAGFLRAPVYGTDAGFVTSAAATSLASAIHQNISGAISAQTTATFTTFKIAGAFGVTMAADQVLTVDGILKSGNNAGTISGTGTAAIQASSGSEMVIRPQGSGDGLTISIPILANGASSLTKTGAGSLTLSAANTYTGPTTVVAGTLTVGSTGSLEDSVAVTVNGGTYANNATNDTVGTVTLKNGVIGGTAIHQASSYAVENGMVTGRLGGFGALTKTTAGQVILSAANTYSGGTVVSGGTLTVSRAGSLDDLGSITIENGAVYELGGADTVGDVTLINGVIRGPGALNGLSYDLRSGRIEAPLAGTGTITKSTIGTVTLAGANTLVGDIVVDAGTLALADNAKLNFVVSDTATSNSVSGSGTATFDGDFVIDLVSGSPDTTPGNEWVLVNPALTESYGATFSVVGFTAQPNGVTWTRTVGPNLWTFSETTGKLTVAAAGYSAWADTYAGGQLPDQDFDFDGVENGIEYFMGVDAPGFTAHPGVVTAGAVRTVTWPKRSDFSGSYLVQVSTDLSNWQPADPGSVNDTGTSVVFTMPAGTSNFVRLQVTPN